MGLRAGRLRAILARHSCPHVECAANTAGMGRKVLRGSFPASR